MRLLIVANHNKGSFVPFVTEQAEAVRQQGVEVDYFGVHGKGIRGYLSNRSALVAKIREFRPDLIHAHYGLSGLLANLQRQVPVVTTFHGSDIHSEGRNLLFSRAAMRLSAYNIFVSEGLQKQSRYRRKNQSVIPCGIDTVAIHTVDRLDARKALGWKEDGQYVLFAGAFDNEVKNSPLAKAATALIPGVQLMEMRGYTRQQVCMAMNAADCLLMTSFREGSPQVVKEAMVCGTPVVSVDVGNVREMTCGLDGYYITSYDAQNIASAIRNALAYSRKTNGLQRIMEMGLTNEQVAKRLIEIYEHCC